MSVDKHYSFLGVLYDMQIGRQVELPGVPRNTPGYGQGRFPGVPRGMPVYRQVELPGVLYSIPAYG